MADDYYGGLTEAGRALGGGIQQAMQMYHQRHLDQMRMDAAMEGLKDLDPKAYKAYEAHIAEPNRAAIGEGILATSKFAQSYKLAEAKISEAQQMANLRAAQAAVAGQSRTNNPDLNYAHAVNAHNAEIGQIENHFNNNYGVGPADILNSQSHSGYVFDQDKNQYLPAKKDQTPDAIGITTGQGFRWLSKDQFDTLKPQAQAWQKLNENPPSRDNYKTPATGNSNAVGQANQIKADYKSGKLTREEAMAQIRALDIPGLQ